MSDVETAIRKLIREVIREELAALRSEPERLLSIPQAAEELGGLARSTVYVEISAGRLRTVKVGGRRLVPSSAIADYIRERAPWR